MKSFRRFLNWLTARVAWHQDYNYRGVYSADGLVADCWKLEAKFVKLASVVRQYEIEMC